MSTPMIVGTPENVQRSVSRYLLMKKLYENNVISLPKFEEILKEDGRIPKSYASKCLEDNINLGLLVVTDLGVYKLSEKCKLTWKTTKETLDKEFKD